MLSNSKQSAYAISLTIDSMSSGSTSAGAMSVHTTNRGLRSLPAHPVMAMRARQIVIKHFFIIMVFHRSHSSFYRSLLQLFLFLFLRCYYIGSIILQDSFQEILFCSFLFERAIVQVMHISTCVAYATEHPCI